MDKFVIKTPITGEDIDNIMSAAMQGIIHWCDEAKVRNPDAKGKELPEMTSEVLSRGYSIMIHDVADDTENGTWHVLNLKKLLKGIALFKNFDFYEWDMYSADAAVQYALFGELRYS